MQYIHILMVDDHPMIIEGYQNTLMAIKNDNQTLVIDTANTCDVANLLMQKAAKNQPYDICFFDINVPASSDGKITSGEDLAKISRNILPKAKVVILTMYNESYRIHSIVKEINPDGFLIKSDLTSSELAEAFHHVLTDPPYYSSTVSNFLNKSIINEIYVDEINRKILHLLSQGIKTRSLTEYIHLSMSAIEKRKRQLKLSFSISDGKDESLIIEARKKGFL